MLNYCLSDADCSLGTCENVACDGYVACSRFEDDCSLAAYDYGCFVTPGSCSSYTFRSNTVPAAVPAFGGACVDTVGCGFACNASEMPELCGNGVDDNDDNGDGVVNGPGDLVDCQDPLCRKISWSVAEVDAYNCLGSNQTGDVLGLSYYCGLGRDASNAVVPGVGLCCPINYYPSNELGYWECKESEVCHRSDPVYDSCDFVYPTQFSSWVASIGDRDVATKWCLDPSEPAACCQVVQFGSLEYYSDTGNVKVY